MTYGGQSMVEALLRVLVCGPVAAGWAGTSADWRDLGYLREPDASTARRQHADLCRVLSAAGAEVLHLPAGEGLSMDAVYVHDPSLMTDRGAVILRMGKTARRREARRHASFYGELGIPVLGEIVEPGTVESGDLVWLDEGTVLAGRGYRTNRQGVGQLREILRPLGVEVVEAPLPHGRGPADCLHLMSILSLVDTDRALCDLSRLAVPTIEELEGRRFRLLDIEVEERETQACNVLALGGGRILALEENGRTNAGLAKAGFEVMTIAGGELAQNGGGGPTCLTRPILRR